MSAPVNFHSVTSDGGLRVLVGKSPQTRIVPLSRKQAAEIIADLARYLAEETR